MTGSEQLTMNGRAVWAYVVELDGGLRVRFDLSDLEQLNLYRGQMVTVRRNNGPEERQFLASVVELPPIAWVVLAEHVRATA
jgi:hypothetical protein